MACLEQASERLCPPLGSHFAGRALRSKVNQATMSRTVLLGLVLGLSMPMDAQGQPSAKRYTAE